MTIEADILLQAALKLADHDRAELAAKLMDSVDPEIETEWDRAWEEEIARRLDELELDRVKAVPWQDARKIIESDA